MVSESSFDAHTSLLLADYRVFTTQEWVDIHNQQLRDAIRARQK